jgi:hypothetical protein
MVVQRKGVEEPWLKTSQQEFETIEVRPPQAATGAVGKT